MPDRDACIELDQVRKSYGRHPVLRGVDLRVERGEIVGLLGPNGSGKTTTLRIVSGFLAPDGGAVRVCGMAVGPDSRAVRAQIGYLPERPPLYDALSVRSYLAFIAAAKGIKGEERRRAVAGALDDYELGAVRRQVIGRLSKGYRQRVGLAQAMLGKPAVLLLDEATSGLDPVQIVEARRLIERDSAGRAVVFSTHIMQEAAALCSRVVVMHQGRVLTVERSTGERDDGQRIEVELGGIAAPAAIALLGKVPGVGAIEQVAPMSGDGVRLRVEAETGEEIRARIASAAVAEATLRELTVHRPSLEERFVRSIAAARAAATQQPAGAG